MGLKDGGEEIYLSLYRLDIQEEKDRNVVRMKHDSVNFTCQKDREGFEFLVLKYAVERLT